MAMKFTGRDGTLKIFDGAEEIARGAQDNMSVYVYDATGPSFTDKTAEAYGDDTSYTGAFWADTNDKIYIGAQYPFARIFFSQGGGVLAVGAGTLSIKYYNGSTWTAITDFNDGTSSSSNTFAKNGYIDFKIPSDWTKQGDASLDSDMYYVQLAYGTLPSTEPSADILAPVDGQFLEVIFCNMDFSGPMGRPRPNERLILDRNKTSSNMHYIPETDNTLYEPLPISFSCELDDTTMVDYVLDALYCANPGSTYWDATGTSSKADTKNDGTNYNPAFTDSSKKTVDIQMIWDGTTDIGFGYYEVYVNPNETNITETDEGVTLNVSGGIYGTVEPIYNFGDRY